MLNKRKCNKVTSGLACLLRRNLKVFFEGPCARCKRGLSPASGESGRSTSASTSRPRPGSVPLSQHDVSPGDIGDNGLIDVSPANTPTLKLFPKPATTDYIYWHELLFDCHVVSPSM